MAVQQAREAAAAAHPNIHLVPDMVAIDLITGRHQDSPAADPRRVWGVYACDRETGHVRRFTGRATVLATGGASRAYLSRSEEHTSELQSLMRIPYAVLRL